jgi:ribonuclease BN (tRNA processing enzyme)
MRLTVLGGSAACPNPGQGSSSYLLEGERTKLLLDCGSNTLLELRKHVEINEIDAILVSHVHSDHTLDLVPYRYGLKYAPGLTSRNVALWMPPDGIAFLDRLGDVYALGGEPSEGFFADAFEISEYSEDVPLDIGEFRIEFHRTRHPVPCWAQRITCEDKTLVYMADTGWQDNLVDIARGADVLISEGTMLASNDNSDIERTFHITAREAGVLATAANAKHLILVHLWSTLGFERYCAEARSTFDGPFNLARPGLVVEF